MYVLNFCLFQKGVRGPIQLDHGTCQPGLLDRSDHDYMEHRYRLHGNHLTSMAFLFVAVFAGMRRM